MTYGERFRKQTEAARQLSRKVIRGIRRQARLAAPAGAGGVDQSGLSLLFLIPLYSTSEWILGELKRNIDEQKRDLGINAGPKG